LLVGFQEHGKYDMSAKQINSNQLIKAKPDISVVIPTYNEQDNLYELHAELMKTLPSLQMSWEIIFVDDGSTDKTWEQILSLNGKRVP